MIFCSLYSGSSGNSIFVSTGKSKVLIDAGMPGKSIEKALNEIGETCENLDGIFVTHEHSDHTKGVGILSRKYNIPIFANSLTWEAMIKSLGNIKDENIKIINNSSVNLNDLDILSYDIPHDAAAPCGYALVHKNKKICIATDLGYFSQTVKNQLNDADVILLESNHDVEMVKFGPYPYPLKKRILSDIGHLSNESCGNAIVELTNHNQKTIILGHLSKTNNFPELAYKTIVNILEENNIKINKDVVLSMAKRDMPSNFIDF
jgi:phosphoribosyl 1,2-cyclic phosphodiesterase